MGCGSSASSLSPSHAHQLLLTAYQNKASINSIDLRVAIKNLSASELDARDRHYGWSALSLAALMDENSNCAKAAEILLAKGADPFSGSEVLYETPLGKCVKYKNIKVLKEILQNLDKSGWDKFTYMLAQPEVSKRGSQVPEGTWVLLEGKKGKTSARHGSSWAYLNMVTFEDGSSRAVGSEKVTVLPQAPSQVLNAIHQVAQEKDCAQQYLERLDCIEETDRKIGSRKRSNFLGLGVAVMMGGA
mmetsp:Transcript_80929/g.143348  ORF Transcript_80929/g.143348 Transcript_80929/m.143348 type:complete len:245 (+) Transcript_80929:82-816(+)